MQLDLIIEEILKETYSNSNNKLLSNIEYNENFQKEGERKSKFIVDSLNNISNIQLNNFVAVSIGGSDGSDLLNIIKNTKIKSGILVEYDNYAGQLARNHSLPTIQSLNGNLDIITGDANQQLENIIDKLKDYKDKGIFGVVIIFMGILHELPSRSPHFELTHYLSRLSSVFENNCIYISEPYFPEFNEDLLDLKISNVKEDRLYEVMCHINAHLFRDTYIVKKMSQGYVKSSPKLILETLHKLLRYDSLSRFQQEMQERLTQFNLFDFASAIRSALPNPVLEITQKTSSGFREAYINSDVSIRKNDGNSYPIPFTHIQISALNLTTSAETNLIINDEYRDNISVNSNFQSKIEAENLNRFDEPLKKYLPNYLELFSRARSISYIANEKANKAEDIANLARKNFASKIKKSELLSAFKKEDLTKLFGVKDKIILEENAPAILGFDKIGCVIFNSGDEYYGQLENMEPNGLGEFKIYELTHLRTPGRVNYYRGECDGFPFGKYGVYIDFNGRKFSAQWNNNHPHFGILYTTNELYPFNIYFGNFGILGKRWVLNGFGIGFDEKNKIIYHGEFTNSILPNTVPIKY